jgi:hypothetical protein
MGFQKGFLMIKSALIQRVQPQTFLLLLTLACICEIFYQLLLALSPLPALHLSSSPLARDPAWIWTLLPSHLLTSAIGPLINSPAQRLVSSLLLVIMLTGVTGTYAIAIAYVLHLPGKDYSRRCWLFLLLAGALLFGLTLLFQPLLLSDDVFTYIFSGRILAIYGADPLNTAPIQFPHDPYLPWVISGRDTPNIFGPLWLCIASLLAALSNSTVITLLLFKGTALLAHLLNCLLVWAILGKIAPERRLFGTLLYAWNPLVLIELAGSGHNEGVLLSLLLLATWLYVMQFDDQGRKIGNQGTRVWLGPVWAFGVGSLIVFGLAISTNLITLLLVPLYIWFDVRTEERIPQALLSCCWRALVILVPTLLISLPFWRGASTFFAITSAMDMEHFVHAPVGTLAVPIRGLFQAAANYWHIPDIVQPVAAADVMLRASATFIFALIYIHLFSQVRHAPLPATGRSLGSGAEIMPPAGFDALLSSCGIAVFWYMVLVSGWFWPWYLLWMLWIVVLQRLNAFTSAMLVLSGTALFIYPFVGFTRGPIATYQSALIFGIPLIYLLIAQSRQRRAERTVTSHE